MKRTFAILIAAVLFAATGLSSLSSAQEVDDTMGKGKMKGDMMGKGPMMGKGGPMQGMMMKGMMEKSIIATADGGVIVLAGNKLIKYDQDLNIVKEVEIKVDMDAMQKHMTEMMKMCPMMKDGKMGPGMGEGETASDGATKE